MGKLARQIEKIVPQLDPPDNDDRTKRESLRSALMESPWAQQAIYSLLYNNSSKSYKQFYDEVVASEQQYRIYHKTKTKPVTTTPPVSTQQSTVGNEKQKMSFSKLGQSDAEVWFVGQAKYGRDRSAPKQRHFNNQSTLTCYNCEKPGHSAAACRHPRDEVRIMAARVRKLLKNKSANDKVKILKKLLLESNAHINFLSEVLADHVDAGESHESSPIDSLPDASIFDESDDELTTQNDISFSSTPGIQEDASINIDESVICHILSGAKNAVPEQTADEQIILHSNAQNQPSSTSHQPTSTVSSTLTTSLPPNFSLTHPSPSHPHSSLTTFSPDASHITNTDPLRPTHSPHSGYCEHPPDRSTNPNTSSAEPIFDIPFSIHHAQTGTKTTTSTSIFRGACLDIGAQRTCIGLKQAKALARQQGRKFNLRKSPFSFRFGDTRHQSLGQFIIRIPTPNNSFLEFTADVVPPDIPLLIGIDTLDKYKLVADNVKNVLEHRKQGWSIPIQRKHGHMYITWDPETIMFTRSELTKYTAISGTLQQLNCTTYSAERIPRI